LATDWDLKNVRFLGQVPYADLPAIYDQCDILVNASRADNFPGSLLEAAAAGLAVVSTDAGGIPHIFEHEVSALLVTPGDWVDLASAILRILNEQGLGLRLTKAALAECGRCDWQQVRQSLYRAYGFSYEGAESSDSNHILGGELAPGENKENANAPVAG
jgi:phenylacetate-CoA ligase